MEADIDEVSVLQTGAEQDGWKVTTEVVSSDDVILTRSAPTAETQFDLGVNFNKPKAT